MVPECPCHHYRVALSRGSPGESSGRDGETVSVDTGGAGRRPSRRICRPAPQAFCVHPPVQGRERQGGKAPYKFGADPGWVPSCGCAAHPEGRLCVPDGVGAQIINDMHDTASARSSFLFRFSASGFGLPYFPPISCSMPNCTTQGTGGVVRSAARSLRQAPTTSNTARIADDVSPADRQPSV